VSFEGYQLKLLKVVSSLTHPSNVNSKRGLQRVQHVHVCIVRKGKYIRKKKPALHLKRRLRTSYKYLILTEKIFQQLNLEMIPAETACWDRERK
jgi:hypothetical protein